jgi:hypothetical protein
MHADLLSEKITDIVTADIKSGSITVQHIQVIILPENLSQNKSEEENEKNQGFTRCRLVRRSLGF